MVHFFDDLHSGHQPAKHLDKEKRLQYKACNDYNRLDVDGSFKRTPKLDVAPNREGFLAKCAAKSSAR
jgi:hypothetical protein